MIARLAMALWNKEEPINYREYIDSKEWREKASAFKEENGNRCALCHASGYVINLHVHHNTYARLGNELPGDLIVLCEECHAQHHKNKGRVGYKPELTRGQFLVVLAKNGITKNNDDPYGYYELGKQIIQHIVDGYNPAAYDFYNKINIEVLVCANENALRRNYRNAKRDGFSEYDGDERQWRADNNYWEGW